MNFSHRTQGQTFDGHLLVTTIAGRFSDTLVGFAARGTFTGTCLQSIEPADQFFNMGSFGLGGCRISNLEYFGNPASCAWFFLRLIFLGQSFLLFLDFFFKLQVQLSSYLLHQAAALPPLLVPHLLEVSPMAASQDPTCGSFVFKVALEGRNLIVEILDRKLMLGFEFAQFFRQFDHLGGGGRGFGRHYGRGVCGVGVQGVVDSS